MWKLTTKGHKGIFGCEGGALPLDHEGNYELCTVVKTCRIMHKKGESCFNFLKKIKH